MTERLTMDTRIRELYDDSILDEALARYGVAKEDVSLPDGFESFIYEYRKGGERYALRVSHSLHRTSDMIQGELEWLNYLVAGGVPAARAVLSARGNLVEPIPVVDGSHFTAVAFEWALGEHPPERIGGVVCQFNWARSWGKCTRYRRISSLATRASGDTRGTKMRKVSWRNTCRLQRRPS